MKKHLTLEQRIQQDEEELQRLLAERTGQNEGDETPDDADEGEDTNDGGDDEDDEVDPADLTGFEDADEDEDRKDDPEPEPEEDPKDEGNFKKRYSDLRRYIEKELKPSYKKQIDELKEQVESLQEGNVELPTTEKEVEAFVKKYPDFAQVIEAIAAKKADEATKDLKEAARQKEVEAKLERGLAKITKAHPDFDELNSSDEFHEWVEKQAEDGRSWIKTALYENFEDYKTAIDALTIYKTENGIKTQSRKKPSKTAAESVSPKQGRTRVKERDKMLSESQVEAMSPKELEDRWDEIMTAKRAGKFVYDLSGGAR